MTEQEFNEWLKENGFDNIDSTKNEETPALAAARGNFSAFEYITKHAPETLSIQNKFGNTPAHYVSLSEDDRFLKIIAKYAPETLSIQNNSGNTPAHEIAEYGNMNMLKIIAEYAPKTFSIQNEYGWTPALLAAWDNHFEAFAFIMQYTNKVFNNKSSIDNPTYPVNALVFLAQHTPEILPIELFDKSREHKKLLKNMFKSIASDMKKNNDGTKAYTQKCAEEIKTLNKIVDEKTKEYKVLKENLKMLEKGKGE